MSGITERFVQKEILMFKHGQQLMSTVELVVVEGIFDNQKGVFVDPPRVTSGYGVVRPERVAELVGIRSLE